MGCPRRTSWKCCVHLFAFVSYRRLLAQCIYLNGMYEHMGCRSMPGVRDLTCDGRRSTYDVSVHKLNNVSFRGKCARMGQPLKLPSSTKLARPGHFPPARQEGRLAGPVFYVQYMSFLCVLTNTATSTMIDCGPIFKEILCKELSLTCT